VNCLHCHEPITVAEEKLTQMSSQMHQECLLRAVAGPIAHQERRCSCFVPGATESDPPGLSKRAAAKLVLTYVRSHQYGISPPGAS
jgi:hypothetical protein